MGYGSKSFMFILMIFCSCIQQNQSINPTQLPVIVTKDVTDISTEGVKLNASIDDIGLDANPSSFGFVWSEGAATNPVINSDFSWTVSFQSSLKKGPFSYKITSDLKNNQSYTARTYVLLGNKVVYGNKVGFISKGSSTPIIIDFNPKQGFDGTEVVIVGKNFSSRISNNTVQFDNLRCTVLAASDSVLKIKTPNTTVAASYYVSVRVADKQSLAIDKFKVLK